MIDCHKSIEREDLWKVVNRKKGVKREKAGRKERQGVKTSDSLRVTSPLRTRTTALECGASPTPSAGIKLLFPTASQLTNTSDNL